MRPFELPPSRVMELVPRVALCLALVSSIVGTSLPVAAAAAGGVGSTARVSTDSNGAEGNDSSDWSKSISADGRYVAFMSDASNLVPGDTNSTPDVFVKDTTTGTTRRVSTDSNGAEGDGYSYWPSISADGRYVAFESGASNLVPGDTNGTNDIFVKDTTTGTTRRVSTDSNGAEGNSYSEWSSISADGRYVAFDSDASNLIPGDTNGTSDVFVKDTTTGTTRRVSTDSNGAEGDGYSWWPSISADGRYVAFDSGASNLIPGDTNDHNNIFVKDTTTGTTRRVSTDSNGVEGNNDSYHQSISADGRYVAFESYASNLIPGDTNDTSDIFVKDTATGTTRRVSTDSNGAEGDGYSWNPSISADGRYVAFESYASNLVPGDTNGTGDIFVKDTATGTTRRVSTDSNGAEGDGYSWWPSISADGRYVAFESYASNLVPGDTNGTGDIFVKDTALPTYTITTSVPLGHGSILPSATVVVDEGSNLTFTVRPDAGYHIADVDKDGVSIGASSSVTFTNVTADHTIAASFAADAPTTTTTTTTSTTTTTTTSTTTTTTTSTTGTTTTSTTTTLPTTTTTTLPTTTSLTISGPRIVTAGRTFRLTGRVAPADSRIQITRYRRNSVGRWVDYGRYNLTAGSDGTWSANVSATRAGSWAFTARGAGRQAIKYVIAR